jgi:hypothetical protein
LSPSSAQWRHGAVSGKGEKANDMKMKHTRILKYTQVFLGITLGIGGLVLVRPLLGESVQPNSPHQSHIRLIYVKIGKLESAIEIYMMHHDGQTPASLDELTQFVNDSNGKPLLTKEDLIDPWGEPFSYEHEGRKYVFWSSGPDKKKGTQDDVFEGRPGAYEASWREKLMQSADGQKTNAVQGATAETVQPPAGVGKTQSNSVPVTTTQPTANPDNPTETKTPPWKIPLLVGIVAILGAMAAWRCFRKGGKGK